jgi:hypothetical protein
MQQTFMHACMVVPCVASDACVESSSYIYGEYLASLSGTDGHARSAHQCVRDEQSRPRAAGAPTRITSRALAVAPSFSPLDSYTWAAYLSALYSPECACAYVRAWSPRTRARQGPGGSRSPESRVASPAVGAVAGASACYLLLLHACMQMQCATGHALGTVAGNVLSPLVALRTTVQCIH